MKYTTKLLLALAVFLTILNLSLSLRCCKAPFEPEYIQEYGECVYIDPCTGQYRWINCDYIKDMPTECDSSQATEIDSLKSKFNGEYDDR